MNRILLRFMPAAIGLLLLASPLHATVRMPALFTDHMVLQHGCPVPVWGWAGPGEKVTVLFRDQTRSATTGSDGRWRINLEPLKPDFAGQTLTIQGSNRIVIADVLVGDVWICSGQSNMEFGIQRAHNAATEIPQASHPGIRLFAVPHAASLQPMEEISPAPKAAPLLSAWQVCTPEAIAKDGVWGGFSAVAYFFAKEIQKSTGRPVGLIGTYWGATSAQVWTSLEGLRKDPSLANQVALFEHAVAAPDSPYPWTLTIGETRMEEWKIRMQSPEMQKLHQEWQAAADAAKAGGEKIPPLPKELEKPSPPNMSGVSTVLFNGMIAPLIPYAIQGVIWYQGEANAGRGKEYQRLFPALISDWREKWKQGDFPFLYVQLAAFQGAGADSWAQVREAQRKTLEVKNTGMVVALDLGSSKEIHPTNKEEVGRRLALAARSVAYGEKLTASGPLYESFTIDGGKVRVHFSNAGGGLVLGPSRFPKSGDAPEILAELLGFELAGADGKWIAATARIDGESVVVESPAVPSPTAVRYGWGNDPVCNLFNKNNLPASPFRSDEMK